THTHTLMEIHTQTCRDIKLVKEAYAYTIAKSLALCLSNTRSDTHTHTHTLNTQVCIFSSRRKREASSDGQGVLECSAECSLSRQRYKDFNALISRRY